MEDSLEAAFIEFGDDKQGFLALSEIRPAVYPENLRGHKRPKISEILKRGQEIVVQVTKDEIGNKGAAVTTYLSLPGRYVVLMHSDDGGGGISRKIDDEAARRRAREVLQRVEVPDGMAIIVRTAGMNRPRVDLFRDLQSLAKAWEQIDRGAQLGRAPTLLYREPDLVVRTIRDYLGPDVKSIVIDSEEEYEELNSYFEDHMPEGMELLQRHEGAQPIFEHYGIERAIEELFERQVKLPSGGYLVIDQTEALVAIDVNSGRSTKEEDHEATVYKTNMEAAKEVARQLRLRDLGGIIVVDLIDMASRRHDRDVERAIKDAMRADKAKVKIGRISENGTLELTRQRLRQAHRLVSFTPCSHCRGTGMVRDPAGLAVVALRQIHAHVAKRNNLARVICRLPVEVANVLNNKKRREILELTQDHDVELEVYGDEKLVNDDIRFDDERRGRAGIEAGAGARDPRLDGDRRGRRGRSGRGRGRDEIMPAGQNLPPPSIGPVPTFLEDEAAFADLDERAYEEEEAWAADESEPAAAAAPRAPRRDAEPQHFDDPLTEALFGDPPGLTLEEAEADAAEAPEPAPAQKKKRRRSRRRRGKKRREDELGADGEPLEDGAGDEGADDEGGTEEVDEADILFTGADDGTDAELSAANGVGGLAHDEGEDDETVVTDEGNAQAEAITAEEAPKKKRSRSRRSRAKKPAEASAEADGDQPELEAAPSDGVEALPESDDEGAPPRARARKKRAPRSEATEEPAGEASGTPAADA